MRRVLGHWWRAGWVARRTACMAVVGLICTGAPAYAQISGSCLGHFGSADQIGDIEDDGAIIRTDRVPVIVESSDIRSDPDPQSPVVSALPFGERVFLLRQSDDYLLVGPDARYEGNALGWVHADTLLCRTTPLRTEEGISQKFFIRTAANVAEGEPTAIEPTAGPRTTTCARLNDSCQSLTRFSLFYIFAEDPQTNRVLLIGRQLSENDTPLIGWVSGDDGYRWNSRYGMRPSDNMALNEATGVLEPGPEIRLCLHETLEEAAAATEDRCLYPILGGPRWFTSTIRIPVLDRVEHQGTPYLRVALPIAGVGEDSRDELLDQVAGLDAAIAALQSLKNIDVYFLIDGTQSMGPHIDALIGRGASEGIIPAIQNAFETDPRFSNVTVRYGYRVYRDTYAGGVFGIVEEDSLRLSRECNPSEADLAANREAVQEGIARIDPDYTGGTGIRDTDHEENLALGLAFAVDDMAACEDNVKLLFIIGDTGFDSERLAADDSPITTEAQIVSLLAESTTRSVDPIVPFFIQVPQVNSQSQNYVEAYDLFTTQAQSMLQSISQLYTEGLEQPRDWGIEENYFSLDGRDISTSQVEMVDFILSRVANYGDQRPVNEIIAGLRTGESLVQIITALQGSAEGIPALRLAQIERRICDTLGAACTERIVSDVAEGYIEHTEDVIMDVLLTSNEFSEWSEQLDVFRDLNALSMIDQSQLVVNMMTNSVQKTLGELTPAEMNMSIADFLALRAGLPVGDNTPLLDYSLRDFVAATDGETTRMDGNEVELCELLYVIRWLERHRPIFAAIDRGEVPLFSTQEITNCQLRRDTMRELQILDPRRFPDPDRMSYAFVRMSEREFWIPENFLP